MAKNPTEQSHCTWHGSAPLPPRLPATGHDTPRFPKPDGASRCARGDVWDEHCSSLNVALPLWQPQAQKSPLSAHLSCPSPGPSLLPWAPLGQPSAPPPQGYMPVGGFKGRLQEVSLQPPSSSPLFSRPTSSPAALSTTEGSPGHLRPQTLCATARHREDPSPPSMARKRPPADASLPYPLLREDPCPLPPPADDASWRRVQPAL